MSKKSYDGLKKHKFMRGLRCFASSIIHSKHTIKPGEQSYLRVENILSKLSVFKHNVCLLSFSKARHSALIMFNSDNSYSYFSAYGNGPCFYEGVEKFVVSEVIISEITQWGDELHQDNVVYIKGLDIRNMMDTIYDKRENYKFNVLSNNCSRFAADVLLAGCYESTEKFRHYRRWQMPANTLELAREIARLQQKHGSYIG
ncbi:hypothetical protein ACLMPM_25635 [Yersinia enterocolitica]|uniref:hypothetical protein n=1 Tax=Yersinia enterocolitica TaxID=630 RepID=UPI00398D175A